jgi:diguanylate cyclase (GGDEF)-like protein
MSASKKYSIHTYVALLTLLPLLTMAVCLGGFFLHDRFSEMDRDLLTRGQLIARQLAASSEYGVFSSNHTFLDGLAKQALQQTDVQTVVVLNAKSKILAMAGNKHGTSKFPVSRALPVYDTGQAVWMYQTILSSPVVLDDADLKSTEREAGAVMIKMSKARTDDLKARLIWFSALITVALLLVTWLLDWLASRNIVEPIMKLSNAIHAIGTGNLEIRVAQNCSINELCILAQGINQMTTDLQHERRVLEQRIDEATLQLRNMAFYDVLTGLPNRRMLNDRLSSMMAASHRSRNYSALMFMDLDNFKPLNDQFGHDAGDLLLMEVAYRLLNCVREADTVSRFGGDEFVVMLGELTQDKIESTVQARIVAEKILARLSELYHLSFVNHAMKNVFIEHHCTASIGVLMFVGHEFSQDEVLKWSDLAMYQAKNAGRNQIHFYSA